MSVGAASLKKKNLRIRERLPIDTGSHQSGVGTMGVNSLVNTQFQYIDVWFFSSRRRHTRLQGDCSSDVCSSDLYAEGHIHAPAQVVETGGASVVMSAQDVLNLASRQLLEIAEPALLPAITPAGIVPGTIQPGEWVSIYGTNLASDTATWTGNFPTSLGGTSVTIDGTTAYLSFARPGQINLQAPNDTVTGTVPVVVTTATGSATSTVKLAQFAPSFFLLDAKHVAGIILRPDRT